MRLYKQKLWQEYKFIRNRLCLGRGKGERGKRHLLPLSQPSEDSGERDGSLGQQGFHLPSWPPGVGVTILPSPAEPGPPPQGCGRRPESHTPHCPRPGSGLRPPGLPAPIPTRLWVGPPAFGRNRMDGAFPRLAQWSESCRLVRPDWELSTTVGISQQQVAWTFHSSKISRSFNLSFNHVHLR